MKHLPPRVRKFVVVTSLLLNLFVSVPALTLLVLSDGIRFYIYELAASRIGGTEIVFIGDSITRDGGIWGLRIERPRFEVRNLGHAGLYTEQMTYQAHSAVFAKARIAFVMAGINDLPKTPEGAETSFKAYVRIVDVLRDGGVEPVIQSTLYTEGQGDREFVTRLNELLRRFAIENEIDFLDLNEILTANQSLKSEYSRDGTHLTEKAYQAWALEIQKYLDR